MAYEQKLPWDLIEEILSRVPPESLVRFRTVSKQWNALCDDQTFINNHKMTFRFILTTKSKFYSVSITPKVEVRELTLDVPGIESQVIKSLVECNDFLLCGTDKGAVVWNPWLRQTRWIVQPSFDQFNGIGYEYDNKTSYKVLASYQNDPTNRLWKIHDLASGAWMEIESASNGSNGSSTTNSNEGLIIILDKGGVSLNGFVYWVAYMVKTSLFFLIFFDFSKKQFFKTCDLPCGENHKSDALVLRVFRGDRFSLLKQCHLTKKIEIWVTKNKITRDGRDVGWIKFMEISCPNLPDLVQSALYSLPSYFIEDQTLVVCSYDKTGKAWIYVVRGNKLSTIRIDHVVDPWPSHCTYFPSLVPVHRGQ